ncbi:glycoside hydrolase family 88 protein [Neobacillus sp. PS3-12]|jgi:unsaturated chondroitin disaccharide hydrolase|uniref:glycoside hydrolase family 88 protein n=1 Tax=Neobacillus sp. PS3-12 TaxID=3070677 RepID=UPI0027E1941E|nr:glycoside hydrolase family 88 protein [Neobacillus sp. PS3-12]WML55102.1 glycoside hydrolase family 88 protein [Neobacillus sp. PS3-12]
MKKIVDEGMRISLFKEPANLDEKKIDNAIEDALKKIDRNIEMFTYKFPGTCTRNNQYYYRTPLDENPTKEHFNDGDNFDWTTSFWTGMLWLAYELTGNEKYKKVAEIHLDSFIERIEKKRDIDTHDLGFLYSLSCIPAYKLQANERAKEAALKAADHLMTRYFPKAEIIQAHGDLNDPKLRGRMIIDCLMNLPLLYWASDITGNKKYAKVAFNHAVKTQTYIIRPDASTFHTYYFNTETGEAKYGETLQGYSDDSCWARGQAWGIYGFPLSYAYTKDKRLIEAGKKVANYFLNRLPKDLVVYWDLIFTDNSNQEKDSSASAIAVCGLMELSQELYDKEEKNYYQNAAQHILNSLIDHYSTIDDSVTNALLLHGVYFKKQNKGVNEACLYGDYFYLEALTRCKLNWQKYW